MLSGGRCQHEKIISYDYYIFLHLLLVSPSVKAHDLSGHYFENDLRALIQKEIIIGYQDGSYQPNRHVTRAEFTTLLNRALELPRSLSSIPFYDVKEKAWYYSDIATAAHHNLIGGYTDGSFKPNRYISRQEMAAMIMRALELKQVHLVIFFGFSSISSKSLFNKISL